MIKVDPSTIVIEEYKDDGRYVRCSLMSDNKDEVDAIGNDGSKVKGLQKNDKLTLGTSCMTSTMDYGILDSEGSWNW